MFVLMRQYPSGGNQHNIYYSERPEGVTDDPEVAKQWDENLVWNGKKYHVEVPSLFKGETKTTPIQTEAFKDMKIDFNINNYVLVKLTEKGKALLEQDHIDFWKRVGQEVEYTPPKEDSFGYSKWQLWKLMERLGKYCILGTEPPFDTNIIIVVK